METHVDVSMRVNASAVTRRVEARMNLVDFLREELGLTGSHVGCEHGVAARARCGWTGASCAVA